MYFNFQREGFSCSLNDQKSRSSSYTNRIIGDELSMLIATATVLHRVFTFDKSLSTTVISGIISAIAMALFITWHCIKDELIMHSVLFGMLKSTVQRYGMWRGGRANMKIGI